MISLTEKVYEWITSQKLGTRFTNPQIAAENNLSLSNASSIMHYLEQKGIVKVLGSIQVPKTGRFKMAHVYLYEYISHEPLMFHKRQLNKMRPSGTISNQGPKRKFPRLTLIDGEFHKQEESGVITKTPARTSQRLLELIIELQEYTTYRRSEARKGNRGLPRITKSMEEKLFEIAGEIEAMEMQLLHTNTGATLQQQQPAVFLPFH